MIICSDSGTVDYKRLWLTNSIRGIITMNMNVQCLTHGQHSGQVSGIVPDSMIIFRNMLSRLEKIDESSGSISIPDLEVDIDETIVHKAKEIASIFEQNVLKKNELEDNVSFIGQDSSQLLINSTWKPSLAITGWSGVPNTKLASNVLRPYTIMRLALRLPPTLQASKALEIVENKFTNNVPYNATVKITNVNASDGFYVSNLSDKNKILVNTISRTWFGNNFGEIGCGGSIPFMKILFDNYPTSQFIITGAAGFDSNIHGPNESINISYLKDYICSLVDFLSQYKK
jgi:acetylornithine deacetylase/succinyl-diaminopimelate desuccinylase-like protein